VLEPRGLLTEYEGSWAQTVAPASGPAPRRAGFAVARPNRKVGRRLERQTILAIVVNDGALFTGFADGQLRRTLGTLGLLHDLVAQLTIAEPSASSAESLSNMGWIRLVAEPAGRVGHRADSGKPETRPPSFRA
jgi:hypothetical protein